jgi:hypothetical protein
VRLGRHVVSWGEGLFFPSISLAQGPADGTKTGIVGTETKDQLLPEDQVSTQIEMSPKWSLLGHLQFGFHTTIAPAPGSYLSSRRLHRAGRHLPAALPGRGRSLGVLLRLEGQRHRSGQHPQWGVGTRYRI